MLGLLSELILIPSGTSHKPGVDRMAQRLLPELEAAGLKVELLHQEKYGDMLLASRGQGPGVLLMGHMDTVFPAESDFNWCRRDGDKLRGPGANDMKGGLVAGLYALKAITGLGLAPDMPIKFLLNSEEEIGSPLGGALIEQLAPETAMAFVLEAGGLKGEVATGRKGRLGLRLLVKGRAGHAAAGSVQKASAILELAHKIIAFEALDQMEPGLSVNVGLVSGGIGANTVPDKARARIDVRLPSEDARERFMAKAREITARAQAVGVSSTLEISSSRPVMPQSRGNQALYQVWQQVCAELGLPCVEEFRSGVSDANFLAAAGVPVLDGLGPMGSGDHSDQEYMLTYSLAPRTQALAQTMLNAWKLHSQGRLFTAGE